MNIRVLRIELRRSVAPWAGAAVLAIALAFLYLLNGAWRHGTTAWTAQWTSLALWTRTLLFFTWPMAVGLGALQGLRNHRSKMSELLTTTSRPAWHRAAALTATMAIALASAFALLVLVGGVQVFANTEYTHLGWLPISLVGALSLVAGAVLGMGAGRALPSVLTPPVLTMAGFVFMALMQMSLGRTETGTASGLPITQPNQVSLLSPSLDEVHIVFVTLATSVHIGQTVWLLGMAATGFALLIAVSLRTRLLALVPVTAGAAIALLVLPSAPGGMYVVDKAATELMCDGPVCVARTHQERLADLGDHGKEALRLLHGALGGRAPVAIRENTAVVSEGSAPRWSRTTVLVDFDDDLITDAKGEELTWALVSRAMVPGCTPVGWSGMGEEDIAQIVAAGWVLGDIKVLPGVPGDFYTRARVVWKDLKALPKAEQLSRINATRDAAISCKGEPLDILSGGASQ